MSKDLANLPNPSSADYAHDRIAAQIARPGEEHAGKVEVSTHLLEDLLKGYREHRLDQAAADANSFEGGDEARGYRKTEAVLKAWGWDLPDPSGRVLACEAEDARLGR